MYSSINSFSLLNQILPKNTLLLQVCIARYHQTGNLHIHVQPTKARLHGLNNDKVYNFSRDGHSPQSTARTYITSGYT